jgi:plasmid stabilization system protein ParE
MSRRLTLRVEAEVDINEAVGWYETQRAGLGIDFIWNLNVILERIQEHPFQFPVVDQEVRRGMLSRFPYGVFFTVDEEEVFVLAVLHLHRHPGTWKSR